METNGLPTPNNVIFGEIQVLLAEKRTALASLRTGIAVFALPLSVLEQRMDAWIDAQAAKK